MAEFNIEDLSVKMNNVFLYETFNARRDPDSALHIMDMLAKMLGQFIATISNGDANLANDLFERACHKTELTATDVHNTVVWLNENCIRGTNDGQV